MQIYQTIDAWQPPCPKHGRCPIAPVYNASTISSHLRHKRHLTITPFQLTDAAKPPTSQPPRAPRGLSHSLFKNNLKHQPQAEDKPRI